MLNFQFRHSALGLCATRLRFAEWKSLSDMAINFMPLVLKASDQCYLKDKLIFSFLSLLVWRALGSNWLVFPNSLNWNQFKPLHITAMLLAMSTWIWQLCALLTSTPALQRNLWWGAPSRHWSLQFCDHNALAEQGLFFKHTWIVRVDKGKRSNVLG